MKRLFLSMLCASALFCACDNDDNDKIDKNYQADDFIKENLAGAKQTFQCQVSDEPRELSLANGVKLTIPGGDVFTKNGTPITGNYTVEAHVMLKPSDAILSGTNTNLGQGSYLVSDGFFRLDVLQEGQSVDLLTTQFLTISIPTEKEDGSVTFLWEGVEADSVFTWKEVDLEIIGDDEREGVDKGGVISNNNNFTFSFKKLGWFNCDIYWNAGTSTTVTVALSGKVGSLAGYQGYEGDTFVFFVAKGDNVIAQLYTEVDETTVKSYDNSMPVGAEGTLLAFSVKDGEYSYTASEVMITADLQVTLELLPVSKEALLAALKALDR
jgi:hypothetical protein